MEREAVPERIEIARQRRGVTKASLARNLGMSSRDLRRIMSAEAAQPKDFVEMLANALGMRSDFFTGEAISGPVNVSFRKQASLTSRQAEAGKAAGAFGVLISRWLISEYPEVKFPISIPELPDVDPETAAELTREYLGIGPSIVPHMIGLLEKSGVHVLSLDEGTSQLAAYCFWDDGVPYILLDQGRSGEASRFDAAHELGHLVMHRDDPIEGKVKEDEANAFASAFLMPRSQFLASRPVPTLQGLIRAKGRWNVSLAAMIRRCRDLGIVDENRYRFLNIEASRRGWLKNEPSPMKPEASTVWPSVLMELWQRKLTTKVIADELCLEQDEVNQLIWSRHGPQQGSSHDQPYGNSGNIVSFRSKAKTA